MKCILIGVVCILVFAAFVKTEDLDSGPKKRFFLQQCESESDCGPGRCCSRYLVFRKYCFPKRRLNQSCNLLQFHNCACEDGLECRVYRTIGLLKFRRCLEIEGSGLGEF